MALAQPKTSEVSAAIVASISSAISQTIPMLPKSFTRVLAKVLAAQWMLVYKYAGFVFLQQFVRHASMRWTTINGRRVRPLVEWGRLIGEGDPEPATQAELSITITVTNQVGSLPVSTQLVRSDTGVIYLLTTEVLLDAATKTATIRASSDPGGNAGAGTIGNLAAGDVVEFANPLANVEREVVVDSVSAAGVDEETPDAYRLRILRRFQRPPQGGAYADYAQWGESVTGVVNVYPYTGDPGEVVLFVEVDADLDPDGIPTAAQLQAVHDAINLDVAGKATRRPVSAGVVTLPITRTSVDVFIGGLDVPDTSITQTAIEEGLSEYLISREPFITGLTALPRKDRVTRAAISGIVDGIVSAAGGTVTSVELDPNLLGTAYSLQHGEKAKLGSISYS